MIYFNNKQYRELDGATIILIFKPDSVDPVIITPFESIKNIKTIQGININIRSFHNELVANVEFKDAAKDSFLSLKRKLRMENDTDVIRYAVASMDKRTK